MGPLRRTPARGHHRVTFRTGAGGCSTYLVMQIHHEWVLVGRVSSRVKHSWRRAGESVGAGLIYRDGRLLGEGRVQLGLILAQQGCQRSVASSPLTPGRGAAGPPRERNRAGVTPRPGAAQPWAGWPQAGLCQPSSQGEMLRASCQASQAPCLAGELQNRLLCSPCMCPPLHPQHKKDPCSPGTHRPGQADVLLCCHLPPSPLGASGLPQRDQGTGPTSPHTMGDRAPHRPAARTFAGGGRGCCRVPPRNGAG